MKKKFLSLALAMVMCLALCVTAFAAEYNSSIKEFYGTGNYSYTAYSTLYADGSRYRAATWIETMGGNVPAGSMGANARLYNSSGTLLRETGMIYNTTSNYFQVATTSSGSSSPTGAYSWGEVDLYNGDHFGTQPLYKTETIGAARALTYQLNGKEYPVNNSGKTYGSALLSEIVGYEPDLISAIGTDGQEGYVKCEDVQKPDINDPKEALAYMQTRPKVYTIPLYNIQEEVIGEFEIGSTVDVSGYTLEEAKNMVTSDLFNTVPMLSSEKNFLVKGKFPQNTCGETYGNALMAMEVGHKPDLQAAIGTDGQEGYVRTNDLSHPKFQTPQEALEWQLSQPESYHIPLYDFQGNEIGSFLIERSSLTVAEMEALRS